MKSLLRLITSPRSSALAGAFVLLVAFVVLPALPAAACPACKETVRGQATGQLSAGFNSTVFMLIGMVFGLVATVAGVIVRAYRKAAER